MFDGTLVKWDTTPINLKMKHGSKPFNARYYLVPIINKENLHKELHCLVQIGVLTPVQKLQYGAPVFMIPKTEDTIKSIMDY